MTLEEIRDYCLSLPGVTENIKWENHVCFSVGDKMFVVTNPDNIPVNASFKTSDELFDELPQREGIIPAPYMARHKWVFIDDIGRLKKKEWMKFIDIAYQQVFQKLPLKVKAKITENKKSARKK
jgi:predicted DNA-binding protein (MmcQ/YjbR family)